MGALLAKSCWQCAHLNPGTGGRLRRCIVGESSTHRSTSKSCSIAQAARVMGSNFHGPTEVRRLFGKRLGSKQFNYVPFGLSVLTELKDTHVLVATPLVSVEDVYARAPQAFLWDRGWQWGVVNWLKFPYEAGWYLVRKEEVPHSRFMESVNGRLSLVEAPEFVPEACVAAFAWVIHYLATGEKMFSNGWVFTDGYSGVGRHICLTAHRRGLLIRNWNDTEFDDSVGVASARKPV